MKTLIKAVEIIDKSSDWHRKIVNVLLNDDIIEYIGTEFHTADTEINAHGLKLSQGWIDMRCSLRDPGFEHKEDLISGSNAALEGGFSEVVCMPNTQPAIQSKEVLAYIIGKSKMSALGIYPAGYVSVDGKGQELTEMIDMHHAGAVAFTDAENPIWHTGLLSKALQYLQTFNGLLINHAEDIQLTKYGQMNEGKTSTLLGLKGIPKIAEEISISRDLELLKYTGGKIHFSRVSSAKSIEMIRSAKRKGMQVSCDIAAHQLSFDDSALTSFDTNLKINPPFRTKEDIDALLKALIDNTIDAVVSDHSPHDSESKNLEFDLADFGIIGLETAFSTIFSSTAKKIDLDTLIEKLTINPRNLLQIPTNSIKEGELARLTLFSTDLEWIYSDKNIKSKSRNSPFLGKSLKGKALAVFNKGLVYKSQFLAN